MSDRRRVQVSITVGLKGRLLAAGSLWALALPCSALAQNQLPGPPPETFAVDPRGVDVASGAFIHNRTDVVIGQPENGGLSYSRTYIGSGWRDNFTGTIEAVGTGYFVSIGGASDKFDKVGSVYVPTRNNGATLVPDGAEGFVYTTSSGVIYEFSASSAYSGAPTDANQGRLSAIEAPSGERTDFTYTYKTVYDLGIAVPVMRLQSVTNNRGYQVKVTYALDNPGNFDELPAFWTMTGVVGFNMATDYCDPTAYSCTFSQTWPSASYNAAGTTITDESGRVTTYTFGSGITSITLPGSASPDVSVTYGTGGRTSSVTSAAGAWSYSYVDEDGSRITTATGPLGQSMVAVSGLASGRVTYVADALTNPVRYQYDTQGRLTRVTRPEGDYTQLTYDSRGNVITTTSVAKPGTPAIPNIVSSATYPATCADPRICNQPTSTTDPRLGVTNYTYAAHGGVATVTAPAPTPGAVRPQTRLTYGARYAWYKNSAGTLVQAPTAVTLPIQISSCSTGSTAAPTCVGTANETRQTFTYGTTGVANNLLPTQITLASGSGTPSSTSTMAYSADGDVTSVDGPLTGTGDTTTYRYDDARQLVGVIGPDPDGGGALLRRALRNTYDPAGRTTLVEQGTVTGLTDPNWAAFVSLQKQAVAYDAYGRPTHQRVQAGSTTYALQQVTYDAAGRVSCSATRMNPATFAAPPASACTLATAGTFGPDRISRNTYDVAGQVTKVETGLGTTALATENATYTDNGQVETLVDGQSNTSTYVYDRFDRVSRLRYPNPASAGSSTTDYDEYTYDAASNVVTERTRGGDTFAMTYDALNRATLINAPSGTNDTTYTYDNLGRVLTAVTNQTLTNTWDALGRMTSQNGPLGTLSYQYDAAGRRTRLTWPDAFYATYEYDIYNGVTAIRENGAVSGAGVLATYAYDNLGRRTTISRGNTAVTTYGYDAVSRLTSLNQNLASTTYDQSLTFGSYNPAGQIMSRTASNDAYAWTGGVNAALDYTNNGRNQVTVVEAQAITYDTRQNILSDGTATYAYNALNQLTTATIGGTARTFQYDSAGRLYRSIGTANTRYLYDGVDLVMELDAAGAILRRHVPGPGVDEPLVTYEGATTTDRRWLFADERGSVIASANASAVGLNRNSYDEYGIPGATNAGRFQYTGQTWLPEADLFYYRARMYDPSLGRFLQTDPIGYVARMNLYAYVGGDPINLVDPFGLCADRSSAKCTEGVPEVGEVVVIGITNGGFNMPYYGLSYTGISFDRPTVGELEAVPVPDVEVVAERRPDYCYSALYRAGNFLDNLGGGARATGLGVAGAGAVLAITGVGAEAGVPLVAAGFNIYAGGVALSALGAGVRWLGGGRGELFGASLVSVQLQRAGPLAGVVGDQAISIISGHVIDDPCG